MKKLLFIFLTLVTIQSFAQNDSIFIKVRGGIPGVYNLSNNATGDSLVFYASGQRYALSVGAVQSVAGKTGTVTLNKSDVGLSNVDNTSDISKPVSTAVQSALNGKFNISDTIGKWLSPGTAGITYATIANLNLKANDNAVVHLTGNETVLSGVKQFNGNLGVRGTQPILTEDVGLWSNVKGAGGSGGVLRSGQFYSNYTGTNAFTAGDFYTSDSTNTNNYDHVVSVQGLVNHLGSGTVNNAWTTKMSGINNGGNITNAYGYYWGGWTGTGTYTNKYAFYSASADPSSLNGSLSVNGKFAFGTSDALGTYQGLYNGINPIYEYQNSGVTTAFQGTGSILFSGANANDFGIMQNNAARAILLGVNGVVGLKVEKTQVSLPVISNAIGDFVTRNSSTGQLQIRTAAQTLTDIGAEPAFTKNTAFNKNFGITVGTVMDAQRIIDSLTAINIRLQSKLDSSYRDTWGVIDPVVSDTVNKNLYLRQSFLDSIRNANYATNAFGLNNLNSTTSSFTKDLVVDNNKAIYFSGQGNLFQNGLIPMSNYNGGFYVTTNGNGSNGNIPGRENMVWTPTGTGIDGINIPTAKLEIKASSGAAGDAPLKIHTSPLMATPEDAAIEKDSSGYINVTTGTVRKKLAYTSDIKNESLQYRDYANDSVAVVDGHLSQWDYYRTGNIVKTVVTLPVFTLSYIVDYTTGANDSTQFFLAYAKNNTPFTVDWGDGNTSDFTNTADSAGARTPTHKYTSNGTYIIKIIFSNPANIANVTTFYLNNYPYAAKVTKVVNLDKLTVATDIELNDAKSLDSMTYDFAYPSTLKTLSLSNTGIIKFTPTHNLPAGLTSLRLNGNNLTTAEVNNTLVWLDGQTFNAGAKTLNISGQAPFSPPSGAGLTAKTSLESKGWTITTD